MLSLWFGFCWCSSFCGTSFSRGCTDLMLSMICWSIWLLFELDINFKRGFWLEKGFTASANDAKRLRLKYFDKNRCSCVLIDILWWSSTPTEYRSEDTPLKTNYHAIKLIRTDICMVLVINLMLLRLTVTCWCWFGGGSGLGLDLLLLLLVLVSFSSFVQHSCWPASPSSPDLLRFSPSWCTWLVLS